MKKTVLVASLSVIQNDGRVRRQIDSLVADGHEVVAFGLAAEPSAKPLPDGVELVPVEHTPWYFALKVRVFLALLLARFRSESAALTAIRDFPGVEALRRALLGWYAAQSAKDLASANVVVLANDWTSLPAAIALHEAHSVPFHYDTHEFATEEHAARLRWRLVFPPVIGRIESVGMRLARSASCPGRGIEAAMRERYAPRIPFFILRNIPASDPMVPQPTQHPLTIVYHGLFKPDRGLERLLHSAASWPDHCRLVLRGRATDARFGRRIEAIAARLPGRVSIVPMVAGDQLTEATHTCDIGVFLPDTRLLQNRYALPNKLFEYISAGLMVIVPSSSEMGDFVREHGIGIALDDSVPLAECLAALTNEQIDAYRARAYEVARAVRWQDDVAPLLQQIAR